MDEDHFLEPWGLSYSVWTMNDLKERVHDEFCMNFVWIFCLFLIRIENLYIQAFEYKVKFD